MALFIMTNDSRFKKRRRREKKESMALVNFDLSVQCSYSTMIAPSKQISRLFPIYIFNITLPAASTGIERYTLKSNRAKLLQVLN